MNRREFSAGTACVLASAAFLPGLAFAQRLPQEGKDFRALKQRAAIEAPAGKVEVVEFFWYNCPHCNAFEPQLQAWIKKLPADVAFRRVPVAFRADFQPQQRLFYALEALGKLDAVHAKVFHAIHFENVPLHKDEQIVAWAGKQGLDTAKFQEAYGSFGVATKVRRAVQLQEQYMVEGVPALGIAGLYYTDGSMTGNMDRAVQVTEFLIAEARKAK